MVRRKDFGYVPLVLSLVTTGFISFGLWVLVSRFEMGVSAVSLVVIVSSRDPAAFLPLARRLVRSGFGVVHLAGVEVVAALQLGQHAGQQVHRLDLVQAAVLLALAARRAHGVEDHRVGHEVSPV